MTSDLGEELALRPLASKTKTKIEDQRCRASSGDPTITKLTSATLAPEVVRPARSCASLNEGGQNKEKDDTSSKCRPPLLRTNTRLSIRRGRSNSRVAFGKFMRHSVEIS